MADEVVPGVGRACDVFSAKLAPVFGIGWGWGLEEARDDCVCGLSALASRLATERVYIYVFTIHNGTRVAVAAVVAGAVIAATTCSCDNERHVRSTASAL